MKKTALLCVSVLTAAAADAQIRVGGEGQLSGSVETNTIYYAKDDAIRGTGVSGYYDEKFGSHTFLKLDYNWKGLTVGAQADVFLPTMRGFDLSDSNYRNSVDYNIALGAAYVKWVDDRWSVTGGTVFDQLGSGLVLRSWEDRALAFNNALLGGEVAYNFNDYVRVKGIYGKPRLYLGWAPSWVGAADLSVSLADIFRLENTALSLEGSYVNRHESLDHLDGAEQYYGLTSPNLNMYSARLNFDWKGFSLHGEYVGKGDDVSLESPQAAEGNAWLVDAGYNWKGLSVLGSFRRLEHMLTYLTIEDDAMLNGGLGGGNVLNYLPAMTRQYTYMLANLNPYRVQSDGEIGGQADVFYALRNPDNRSKYWNFHANFSTYYSLEGNGMGERRLLWREINFDVERQWNRKIKTTLLYTRQEFNYGFAQHNDRSSDDLFVSNIFIGDLTYKFDRRKSLRAEVQYLYSDDFEGDWVAALVEFNMAPKWSFYVSDMYNIDKTAYGVADGTAENHFYNVGASFTHKQTRVALSYGRNRAGYVCSGGVCRFQPAYTGVNFVLTSSF